MTIVLVVLAAITLAAVGYLLLEKLGGRGVVPGVFRPSRGLRSVCCC